MEGKLHSDHSVYGVSLILKSESEEIAARCGMTFEASSGSDWRSCRAEIDEVGRWYLVDADGWRLYNLEGVSVRSCGW